MPRKTHKPVSVQSRKKRRQKPRRLPAKPGDYNRRLNQRIA